MRREPIIRRIRPDETGRVLDRRRVRRFYLLITPVLLPILVIAAGAIVVWGTEFGRSPGAEGTGRDHHPNTFSCWLAGGGIKGGVVHGATDEIGFYATEHPHYVTDIHATVLYLMGLDPLALEVPGRRRLDIDRGKPILQIMA